MDDIGTSGSRSGWSRFGSNPGKLEFVFVPENVERAIEPLANNDVGARRRQRSLRSQELDELSVKRDRPVVVNLTGLFKAEDIVEVDAGSRAMDVSEAFNVSEASVMVIGEEAFQHDIGIVDGGDVMFAQEFDETVLMGAIGTFDTSLGLGRMGVDAVDTKTLHRKPESG